jgi:6-phosphofructokinase 2
MQRIVTLTLNPAIDKSSSVDRVEPEKKLRCLPFQSDPGGGGINVSKAIKNLGGQSLAYLPLGGMTGDTLKRMLDEQELAYHAIPIVEPTREDVFIMEESTHCEYRFIAPGPSITEAECRALIEEIESMQPAPEYFVASGSLPPGVPADIYARLARWAKEKAVRMIVDCSGEALRLAAEEGVFLLAPNNKELGILAHHPIETDAEQEEAVRALIARGECKAMVVTLGSKGALLGTAEGLARFHAPEVPVKSKVGAGDSATAGIVLALARGDDLHHATLYGMAAGAAAVMTPGAELCRKEDTERLYGELCRHYESCP